MNHTIVIIGSGHMGAGIAAIFSAAGHTVVLLGRDVARLQARLPAIGALAATLQPVHPPGPLLAADLNEWNDWGGVALVIETISEDLAAKRALFADLDHRVPPHIPIGSNSSGYGIDEMTEGLGTTDRMLNVHYSMPAHIVPMVEVAMGSRTSLPLAEGVCRLIQATGKKTTLIRQYIPGLLITRLQHALMREALSLVDRGLVTPQDIDDAVRFGFGFRFAALGPMAQKEMSGWDTHVASGASVYPSLSNISTPPACVADLVRQGRTGMKSGAGFEEWTPDEVAAFRQRYEARLQAAFAVLGVAPD
ncbi:3-hydroxyacyl-CoA dehydrogenase NAD-binding domain-containing protein [Hydrogenophaga sp. H7]|uniref:3-hydroxyacyl-CoA dehydrogenase NAD-binding domain-containing protein n=1 Tax=Hydrogenophaga sp. H7 TaxID=1882399 RepID=UPI0009CF6C2E|nr:3-hydroxyacyl-CoA dehydrogenase NAD-binding domain-containing protein [Hydrogenophaga sp. H7]OPF62110.1 3-hydroxyacyl-CoA dehydrogenase [Hydrogenophaga sp. H7]